jgi:hypothetical protein
MAQTSASCLQRKVQEEKAVIWNIPLRPGTCVSDGAYRAVVTTQRRRLEGAICSPLNGPPGVHAAVRQPCVSFGPEQSRAFEHRAAKIRRASSNRLPEMYVHLNHHRCWRRRKEDGSKRNPCFHQSIPVLLTNSTLLRPMCNRNSSPRLRHFQSEYV